MMATSTSNDEDGSDGADTESIPSEDEGRKTADAVRVLSRRSCKSLIRLASSSYLRFLERECATYVQLLLHDSRLWRSTRDALFRAMKNHIRNTFQRYAKEYEVESKSREDKENEKATTLASRHRLRTGFIRGMLMDEVLSGRFPTDSFRNSYRTNDPNNYRGLHGNEHGGDSDSDLTAREIESLKLHGRKCGSVCCSGGFIVETMLCVLANEDVDCINLEGNLSNLIYKDKPLNSLLQFDTVTVLSHYVDELDRFQNKTNIEDSYRWNQPSDVIVKEYPALQTLKICGTNLGSMGQQTQYNDILKTTQETQAYNDIPWKLSNERCRPTTHHMMLILAKLFDRGPSFKHSFYFLKELRLGRDCLNTNIDIMDFTPCNSTSDHPVAHPAVRMMSGIARSCPSLEIIDFSGVLSLSPESLVYLFFRDAFETLHKYMYLPRNPNLNSREVNSRRRSEAASMNGKGFGLNQNRRGVLEKIMDEPTVFSCPDEDHTSSMGSSFNECYKHGAEGRRVICPWCISESSLTPRSSNSDIFLDKSVKKSYFKNDVSRELYVLDDRLYDYIESRALKTDTQGENKERSSDSSYLSHEMVYPSQFLRYCVKVGQLVSALTDDDYFLDSSYEESCKSDLESDSETSLRKFGVYRKVQLPSKRSTLCGTLRQLRLPFSLHEDSCTWILPLIITAAPNITTLGNADVYDGLEMLKDIIDKKTESEGKNTKDEPPFKTNLEEINVTFEDTATSRIREDMNHRLKTLGREYLHWNQFIRPNEHSLRIGTYLRSNSTDNTKKHSKPFHLDNWIRETISYRGGELLAETQLVKARWIEKVKTIARMCPRLKTLNMSIQPSILFDEADAYEVWSPMASQMSTGVRGLMPYLTDVSIYDSCWSDISGLLKVAGDKIEKLNLMMRRETKNKISDATSMDQVNLVPLLCPRMCNLHLGYTHGTGIGTDRKFNHALNISSAYPDKSYTCYRYLQEFEANGNITITAFEFLWFRALMLKELKVKGSIVVDSGLNIMPTSSQSNQDNASNSVAAADAADHVGPADNLHALGANQGPLGNVESGGSSRCRYSEIIFTPDRVFRIFSMNPMVALTRIDVPMTFASIDAATRWLDMMPASVRYMAHLTVKVSIPSETAGGGTESIGDLVATCLRQMVEFKLNCRKREVENDARVGWSWRREGILTILLQQQIMTSVSELIDP